MLHQDCCTTASSIQWPPATSTEWLGAVPGQCTSPDLSVWTSHITGRGGRGFQQLPWHHQQIRTRKRGTEYQPKNIKRKRTHGWIKRISTQGGIEVILRRMLKGRKSLSH
ncbi:LOW QUALITY PROTEIN: 39S ribosomal protein L34, mitochondrial [Oncorhynchus tshawytscha]|uniref:LOW QUALITY PROTEIN: 39S ribosomal protein L34, mitochondrial n=1 Tax=Oncorhynchus tshawytscha TaxID=74940 RepID=UPI001C3D19E9|nr:LOW QUALITY PROTEIN: 39S ribosomal protein L34, mitochondrial [Oncorhynchus tshawytscha]